jgi:hypothetical protein
MIPRVFVFKVALADDNKIWRRIAVRSDQTLDHLHAEIYKAFDREEEHLYSFFFPPPGTRTFSRAKSRRWPQYASPEACGGDMFSAPQSNAGKTKVSSLGLEPKQVFFYLFDWGDEWWHEIKVEAVDCPVEEGRYPRILESHGKSPPQYGDSEDEEDCDEDDDFGDEED